MNPGSHLDWNEAVELLAAQSGVVALLGAVDVGKSTLALSAANLAVELGRRPAILDTDLGQGEVGPPGTLGVVRLEEPAAALSDLKPRALAFVGALSPIGHLLSLVQGTHRLVTHALERDDDVVLVDTSGMVHGRLAEKLKLAKLAVLAPSLVVIVERDRELERLAALVDAAVPGNVVRVRTPPDVRRKSSAYRRVQRANRFRRHMEKARVREIDAGQVRTFDGWLYGGEALTVRQLRSCADALKTPVPHGELTPDGLFLCAEGRIDRAGLVNIQEDFPRRRIYITPASMFQNLLVGLIGEDGHLADIGLIQGVNFERAFFSVLTPIRSLAEVRMLHFGRLRVRPDGLEIAHLRPSDL